MNLNTPEVLTEDVDNASVWATVREHDMRADAYAWHNLLAPDPARLDSEEES